MNFSSNISKSDQELLSYLILKNKDFSNNLSFRISGRPLEKEENSFKSCQKFYVVNNPDGSIRWFFPTTLKSPTFLKFYNASSLKSQLFVWFFKIVFFFRLQRYVLKKIFLYHSEKPYLTELCDKISSKNYSLFTGTVGRDRTILIEYTDDFDKKYIVKLPYGTDTFKTIQNEYLHLNYLNKKKYKHIKFPKVKKLNDENAIRLTLLGRGSKRNVAFTKLHTNALNELYYNFGIEHKTISDTLYWKEINDNYHKIDESTLKDELKPLYQKLSEFLHQVNTSEKVQTGFAHGDFTPWNMFQGNSKIELYDFEFSTFDAPLLVDYFHFIFSKGILLNRSVFKYLYDEIKNSNSKNGLSNLIEKYNIDIDKYLQLYIAHTTAKYILKYNQQAQWHTQINWLIATWEDAFTYLYDKLISTTNCRSNFVARFFKKIESENYVLLKFTKSTYAEIDEYADIDLLIDKSTAQKTVKWINELPQVSKASIQKYSYMWICDVYFEDGSFIELDFIFQFKWKNKFLFIPNKLLENYRTIGKLKLSNINVDLLYTLQFYLLNNKGIPKKYLTHYSNLLGEQTMLTYINECFNLSLANVDELEKLSQETKSAILTKVNSVQKNRFSSNIFYLFDTIKRKFFNKGIIITFSGVDGAGKSTILASVKEQIEKKYRKKTVVLRHRPSILPILSSYKYGKAKAENIAANTLPHSGSNKNNLLSIFRFIYYYIDYLVGQFYVKLKYLNKGYIVIYDRYYFDFIADPKRSNIVLNAKVSKFLYHLIAKPKLNFFLHAPANIIRKRKKELTIEKIKDLTNAYMSLFKNLAKRQTKSKYICIENITKEKTENEIFNVLSFNV